MAQFITVANTNCTQGQMAPAHNIIGEYGQVMPVPGNAFRVIVDTGLSSSGFISSHEQYYRQQSLEVDTSIYHLIYKDWKQFSVTEKRVFIEKEKARYARMADSTHEASIGRQLIHIVNNTDSSIAVQMQDWSFIGILEALTKDNEWKPVQYWQFSKCGNSYRKKHIAPHTSLSFITPVHTGNYKTRLRYKILGKNQFYYSNQFEGSIDYCEFYDATSYKTDKLEKFTQHCLWN